MFSILSFLVKLFAMVFVSRVVEHGVTSFASVIPFKSLYSWQCDISAAESITIPLYSVYFLVNHNALSNIHIQVSVLMGD